MSFVTIAAVVGAVGTVAGTTMSIIGQKNASKAQEYASEYNADQARKQAAYDEGIARENMRRQRANNQRELARRRANNARGGLAETGAVTAALVETDKRLQVRVDDIWDRAAQNSSTLEARANMSLWEGKTSAGAAKTAMWGTAVGGAARTASYGMDIFSGFGGGPKPNPNQLAPLKALPPPSYK